MLKEKAMKDPKKAASRGIPDPALLEQTMKNHEAWALYMELMESTFDRMGARLAGTANDIESTRKITFPLEQIKVPAMVVHGTKDSIVPFEQHGKVLAARIPHAELLLVEGGDHTAIFSHRDQVREAVATFMKEVCSDS